MRAALCVFGIGLMLTPLSAAAQVPGARSTDEPGARSRDQWVALRDAKFEVPPGESAFALLREMNALLGSTDPFLRDNVAYEAAAKWIYTDGLLTPDQQREVLAMWTANLRQGLGETGTDAVFQRSFSALSLSLMAARDNREPFLTKPEFDVFFDAMVAYFESERDARGYDKTKGWVHTAAHTADALKFLARNTKLDAAQQARLLVAIDRKAGTFGEVFQWGEDSRIGDVVVSLVAREDFDHAGFDAWLAAIPPRRKALWANAPAIDPAAFPEVQNLTLVLRSVLVSLTLPAELPPQAVPARASLIATLRAMR